MTFPWSFPPIFPWRLIISLLLLLQAFPVDGSLEALGIKLPGMYGTGKLRRDVNGQEIMDNDTMIEEPPTLEELYRRSLESEERKRGLLINVGWFFRPTYVLSSTMNYMATPFGACDPTSTESRACPTDYKCVCQGGSGTSVCLPGLIPPIFGCALKYFGPTDQPESTVWVLQTTDTYMASFSGQCGGTTPTAGTATWSSGQTACPTGQVCDCQNKYYSQCVDVGEALAKGGTSCPANEWACEYDTLTTLPPPEATASMWEQCGGLCWTGPTNCPDGASCWTETSPFSGMYAQCNTARPDESYEIKAKRRARNVPARVSALPTPTPHSF